MKIYLVTGLILYFLPVFGQDNSSLSYIDKIYDQKIKTVQLYPLVADPAAQTYPPVISLHGQTQLVLEFDELFEDARYYRVRLIHCNANWQPSGLADSQFLEEYNEFEIMDYEYSFNTLTPYVHYTFTVPRPTLPGNYLLMVYDAEDEKRVILSRRFLVFEQQVSFTDKQQIIAQAPYSLTHQPLQFTVYYNKLDLLNPREYVKVHILQNHRWDNALLNLAPSFVYEDRKALDYKYYDDDKSFPGGNEFRYFDMRSLKYPGFHIRTVSFQKNKIYAWLENDKPRQQLAYTIEMNNMRGNFFIDNIEQKIPDIENDYALVSFTLKGGPYKEDVYISGRLTDWQKSEATRMHWNAATQSYEGTLVLKQGQYAYQYLLDGDRERQNDIEGNKRETRNRYEILVYYYSQTLRTDLLIGYYSFIYDLQH